MTIRLAINGFGRIGRRFAAFALKSKHFEIVAINDLADAKTLTHLFKYDTVFGKHDGTVKYEDGHIFIDGHKIKMLSERNPAELPWKEMKVDIVIESTGIFRKKEDAEKHLEAGAKKVLISAPGKSPMRTIVLGVNEDEYDPKNDHVLSNASCTTNCLTPVAKVLHEEFGIKKGLMTTTHAVTTSQSILDLPHKDLRRARAAGWNIIPTTTGAAKATALVYPEMEGRLDAMAMRVPVMDGSVVDLTAVLEKEVTLDEVNEAFMKAAEGELKGILEYADEPIVSSDIIGNTHSSIYDSLATIVMGDMVKVLSWYDNEAGYAMRMVNLAEYVAKKL
ncbi:type I glyceraldehyde-3-phosphate dehydrogenase [Candidatus Thorarchaeota archaeon]|nr:MAG: type I glyceraldehyde-3-phosphate dehydrogenase [Candidatus Thorarchaeota archaeon]